MVRAVLFDLDDTLVDQASAADAAVVRWAAAYGVTDDHVVRRWRDVSDAHYGRYQRRELTFAEQRRARVRDFLDADLDDAQADAVFGRYLEDYEAGWTVFPDARPALRRAREAGLTVAVFTNGDHDHQQHKLRRLGLAGEIDVLVASSTLPAGKPDPRAFRGALAVVGVPAAAALMVGNSLVKDVAGALAVGLDAVLLDRHGDARTSGIRSVRTLDELSFAQR